MLTELLEIAKAYMPLVVIVLVAMVVLFFAIAPRISKWLIKTDIYMSTKGGKNGK